MPHRDLQVVLDSARPYFELAGWILQRIVDLRAGERVTVEAAARHVEQLGDARIAAILNERTDWLLVAESLLAESIRILETRNAARAPHSGSPPQRGAPSAGPPRTRTARPAPLGAPKNGPPKGGLPRPRSARPAR